MNARDPIAEQVEVQVASLEFDGLEVREPARVQSAFQSELTRLLVEHGLPSRLAGGAEVAAVDGGTLTEADLGTPERLGRAVARQVHAGLSR